MYLGADLSYVNEVEDNGAVYSQQGRRKDPFQILKDCGANIVRVRLWHTPTWTAYSNLADVIKTLRRAKALDMTALLDFHYSDTWADPAKQIIPAAWAQLDQPQLEQAMHDYTVEVLSVLDRQGLMPEFVQVGNEINTEILMPGPYDNQPIRWERNVRLINAGISGVREAGKGASKQPRVMLHIAQPENLLGWFDAALEAGIADFDDIGMSYYPKWSVHSIPEACAMMGKARAKYGKDVMLVEVAYPWTLAAGLAESHLLAEDCILPDYPATPQGQRQFLTDVTQSAQDNGVTGVVYWEPAWISSAKKPSIWENSTWFDYDGEVHEGIEFMSHDYRVSAQE